MNDAIEIELHQRAQEHLRSLILGIDPVSQGNISADSPLAHPEILRSLVLALGALEGFTSKRAKRPSSDDKKKKNDDGMSGKPWKRDEDERLKEEFGAKADLDEMAKIHARSEGGIIARLVRLKLVQSREEARAMFGR